MSFYVFRCLLETKGEEEYIATKTEETEVELVVSIGRIRIARCNIDRGRGECHFRESIHCIQSSISDCIYKSIPVVDCDTVAFRIHCCINGRFSQFYASINGV